MQCKVDHYNYIDKLESTLLNLWKQKDVDRIQSVLNITQDVELGMENMG